MKTLLISLCCLTTALADPSIPDWTKKQEQRVESLTTQLTPQLRKHTVMVGRLGLTEIRPAVLLTTQGDLLAPYLKPIDSEDESPYLLYLPDGSRQELETIGEKTERGITHLRIAKVPEGITPAPLAPNDTHLSCHWFLLPSASQIPALEEPMGFALSQAFPRPEPESVSFTLKDHLCPDGTLVFDLAGRLTAILTSTERVKTHALLVSRLAEDLESLATVLPQPTGATLPELPLAPEPEEDDEEEDRKKKKEEASTPLMKAREALAFSLMPKQTPYALVLNEGKAITHSITAIIIREDGLLLTKASELGPMLAVRYGGKKYPASLLATDEATDLALIGINASDLPVIQWASPKSLQPGSTLLSHLLVQNTTGEMVTSESMSIGHFSHQLSGDTPKLHSASQVTSLGIIPEQASNTIRVASIKEGSPASEADLKPGDEIIAFEKTPINQRATLARLLAQQRVGDQVTLTIKRDGVEKKISLSLTSPYLVPPPTGLSLERDLVMTPSVRRYNFPEVLVHTLPLNAWDCGSPLYNLEGQAVGLNISASSPHYSLALPPSVIKQAIERMSKSSLSF